MATDALHVHDYYNREESEWEAHARTQNNLRAAMHAEPRETAIGLRVYVEHSVAAVQSSEGAFAASLRCDIAEAVRSSDARFEYCGVSEGASGAAVAMINVLPDAVGMDARTPTQIASELQVQAYDSKSALRRSNVGSAVTRVEIAEKRPRKAVAMSWTAGGAGSTRPPQAGLQQHAELDGLEREYARRYVTSCLMSVHECGRVSLLTETKRRSWLSSK